MNQWLAELPTTNLRILATILAMLGTTTRVLLSTWMPAWEWLAFLCVWAGLDITQFLTKRATYKGAE
jgi:hypothetical protein